MAYEQNAPSCDPLSIQNQSKGHGYHFALKGFYCSFKGGLHDAFDNFILYYNFLTNSLKFIKFIILYIIRKGIYKEDNGNVDFLPKITIF